MWITLEENHTQTLTRQLYEKIRSGILTGQLASAQKLPSTRHLATELGIARNTVMEAYSQLIAEGYLESFHGSATRVVQNLPAIPVAVLPSGRMQKAEEVELKKRYSNDAPCIDFRTGMPALELFPRTEWIRRYREVCLDIPAAGYGYCNAFGVPELREALCRYLLRVRGITCEPQQIMITSGATQGVSLLARLFGESNKHALVEDPSHPGLRNVITSAGCVVKTGAVDEKGLITDQLQGKRDIAFVYTTPSHQYPMGGILPIQRRLELIQFVRDQDCFIIEDDYDSEFRYSGPPVSSMYELEPERVIYIGSFSKTLSPALRLGYMIIPAGLIKPLKNSKVYSDVHTDALNQYTLAKFLDSGAFEQHIWKMKKYYIRQREALLTALKECFPGRHEVLGDASGLHLVVHFKDLTFTPAVVNRIAQAGVKIYPVSNLYLHKREPDNLLVMGYSHIPSSDLQKGLEIIKATSDPLPEY